MKQKKIQLSLLLAGLLMAQPVQSKAETDITNSGEGTAIGYFNYNIGGNDHPPPYAPGVVTGPIASPTLFSIQGLPAQVKGFPMLTKNFFSTAKHDVTIGCSRGTKIIYNGADINKRKGVKERKISFSFNGISEGEVVGAITIQSRKNKADEVDFPTLIHDASNYINDVDELKGYNITLLSLTEALTYTLGVDTKTAGYALSPFVSGFINGPAGVLSGLASGASKSGGVTVPTATIGGTFLVLIDSENSRKVNISNNYRVNAPQPAQDNENDNNRKKMRPSRRIQANDALNCSRT
ncbi:hypothetical protein [Chlorobium phaeovibrioides]|uniref:hypothetical protein n=1 Tax=Chlorobium phaeovibrioides TaxID=1094 RepID=UPI001CE48401|nr:hypothetical protein [Chlorobium phaeovibrioides]